MLKPDTRLSYVPDSWGSFTLIVEGSAADTVGTNVAGGIRDEETARRLAACWNRCACEVADAMPEARNA